MTCSGDIAIDAFLAALSPSKSTASPVVLSPSASSSSRGQSLRRRQHRVNLEQCMRDLVASRHFQELLDEIQYEDHGGINQPPLLPRLVTPLRNYSMAADYLARPNEYAYVMQEIQLHDKVGDENADPVQTETDKTQQVKVTPDADLTDCDTRRGGNIPSRSVFGGLIGTLIGSTPSKL